MERWPRIYNLKNTKRALTKEYKYFLLLQDLLRKVAINFMDVGEEISLTSLVAETTSRLNFLEEKLGINVVEVDKEDEKNILPYDKNDIANENQIANTYNHLEQEEKLINLQYIRTLSDAQLMTYRRRYNIAIHAIETCVIPNQSDQSARAAFIKKKQILEMIKREIRRRKKR